MFSLTTTTATATCATRTVATMEPRVRCRRACAPRAAAARDASVDAPRGRRDALALALSTACAAAALGAPRAARAYGTGGWKDCAPICDELKNGKADQDRLMAEMMEMSRTGTVPPAKSDSASAKPAVDSTGRLVRKQK
jgi:hypothetical protein